MLQPFGGGGHPIVELLHNRHQELGGRGWCLQRPVGQLVGHRAVYIVADADNHRYRAGGDGPGDVGMVEGHQVGTGPASSNNNHHIVGRLAAASAACQLDSSRQSGNGVQTLNPRVVQSDPERLTPGCEFVDEVKVGGALIAGHQTDPQR